MSVASIDSSVSGLSYQMKQKGSGGELQGIMNDMSADDRADFQAKMKSMSPEQKMEFKSQMKENSAEISQMSQEDATVAIFELLDEVSSLAGIVKDEDEESILDVLDTQTDTVTTSSISGDTQDPLANLSEENLSEFLDMISNMTTEQKQEFSYSLMDSKEELATLESDAAAELVMSLLEEASVSTTNSSTQNMMSNFTRGGSFLDIYS